MNNKKIALITGASSGIGKEFAEIHASHGGDVVIVARREDKLLELKKHLEDKYKINVYTLVKDLGEVNAGKYIYNEVKKLGLNIDYLINNAGFGGLGDFLDGDFKNYSAMIQLNITVLTELTGLFVQDFVKKNAGKILNVSSSASLIPGPGHAVYFATKAYVTSFSNALFEELSNTKVTVTALLPGATLSEFGKKSGMDKTDMFGTAKSAKTVALDGYNGMLNNEINVLSALGVMDKFLLKISNLLPKKFLLETIYKTQKITK